MGKDKKHTKGVWRRITSLAMILAMAMSGLSDAVPVVLAAESAEIVESTENVQAESEAAEETTPNAETQESVAETESEEKSSPEVPGSTEEVTGTETKPGSEVGTEAISEGTSEAGETEDADEIETTDVAETGTESEVESGEGEATDVDVDNAGEQGIIAKLNTLRNTYINGWYWWKKDGVNQVTTARCPHNPYTTYCGLYNGGYQCWAFASRVFCDVFGQNPNIGYGRTYGTNPADVRVGDYVRYSKYRQGGGDALGHSVLVIAKNGSTITVVENNTGEGPCRIRWDGTYDLNGTITGYDANGKLTQYPFAYYCRASNWSDIPDPVPPPPPFDRVTGAPMNTGYARTIPDGYYHIASSLGDQWWLTIAGMSNDSGANVQLYDYSIRNFEVDEQLFYFQFIDEGGGQGFYKITNKKSGKCLDVVDGSVYMYGTDQKPTNVQQCTDNGSAAQRWAIREIDGGDKGLMYTFQARCSGFSLDLYGGEASLKNGANISMHIGNETPAQRWRLVPYAPSVGQTITDGEYQIVSKLDENKAIGFAGSSASNGVNAEFGSFKGNGRQTFDVKYLGDGYYSITNKYSGLALEVAGNSRNIRTNVQLATRGNGDGQKWTIKDCGNGYYHLVSKASGLCLDLSGGATTDGTNIALCKWIQGNDAIKWKFIPYEKPDAIELRFTSTEGKIINNGKMELKVVYNETASRAVKLIAASYTASGKMQASSALSCTLANGENKVTLPAASLASGDCIKLYCLDPSSFAPLTDSIVYSGKTSEWVLASQVPAGATILDEKWTYTETKTETATSDKPTMEGWRQTGITLQQTGSGTHYYASYPGGFSTGHWLYNAYSKSALPASDTAASKRIVSGAAPKSYIYWHWTFNSGPLPYGNYNVYISDVYGWDKGRNYQYFSAFESGADFGHIDPTGANGKDLFCKWNNNPAEGSWWWFRFPVYQQTYTDYKKIYSYEKKTATERESQTRPAQSDTISNLKHLVKYSK